MRQAIRNGIYALILSSLTLSGCGKSEGNMSKTNSNKTTVYTVDAVQDNVYVSDYEQNYKIGNHKYYFETKEDGKSLKKFVWIWTVDTNVIKETLQNVNEDVSEDNIQAVYTKIDEVMHNCVKQYNTNFGERTTSPDYLDLFYSKSTHGMKTTVKVMVDLTDKSLNLSEEEIQYKDLSNYIWPYLFNSDTQQYEITKSRIKKSANTIKNQKRLESDMPIISTDYKISEDLVKNSELESTKFEKLLKQDKKIKKQLKEKQAEQSAEN